MKKLTTVFGALTAAALLTPLTVAIAAESGHHEPAPAEELANIDRDGFSVDVDVAPVSAGKEARVVVRLVAKEGYKINEQYPHKLTIEDVPEGLEVAKTTFKKDDATTEGSKSLTFSVPATPQKAGKFAVRATLRGSVCNAQSCLIQSEKLSFEVVAR